MSYLARFCRWLPAGLSLLTACSLLQPLQDTGNSNDELNGSWILFHDGQQPITGMTPPANLMLDSRQQRISGFDGCNRLVGTYRLQQQQLLATIVSTRLPCHNQTAQRISQTLQALLRDGAEITATHFMGVDKLEFKDRRHGRELRWSRAE